MLVWNKTNPAPLCNGKYLSDCDFVIYIHRRYIGIELDDKYFDIACERIKTPKNSNSILTFPLLYGIIGTILKRGDYKMILTRKIQLYPIGDKEEVNRVYQ